MSRLGALQQAKTLEGLAQLIGYTKTGLEFVVYGVPREHRYVSFQIPKRSGGTRTIQAPDDHLKLAQRRLADLLQDCWSEIQAKHGRSDKCEHPDAVSHGFVRKRNIMTNGQQHRRRRFVFNVDLAGFFPSLNFGRVRGFFIKNTDFGLSPTVATVIAQIACLNNELPQGSPCSPVIANLIAHVLDVRLIRLAARNSCTYTRYADDLTFSTNKRTFPSSIAVQANGHPDVWKPGDRLLRILERSGFCPNRKKTRMQYKDSRQGVTGLVVNRRVNVTRELRRTLRVKVLRLVTTGTFAAEELRRSPAGGFILSTGPGSVDKLAGQLAFVDSVDRFESERRTQALSFERKRYAINPVPSRAAERIHRRFLLYTGFFAAPAPIVLCEGKTDPVYLTHAIRSLHAHHPTLATKDAKGNTKLSLRLFRYSSKMACRLLGLGGGTGNFPGFIQTYKQELKTHLTGPGGKHPVVILLDNDSGLKAVWNKIQDNSSTPGPLKTWQYIHLFANLYVLLTPRLPGDKDSMIEDFFDAHTRGWKLGSKTFNHEGDYDKSTEYGKSDFAHKVIAPNAASIDFSGFAPLLSNLEALIAYHATIAP